MDSKQVTNMKLTNYQRALAIIRKLEDQFGSVTNVPDSNLEMQEIHRLFPPIRCTSTDTHYDYARWLNREGYSVAYIAQVTHRSKITINNYFATYNIKPKQPFKYRIKSNSATDVYYGTSLVHVASLLLHRSFRSNETARAQLNAHGFSLKKSYYIWFQIPDGAYYTLAYLDHFVIKNGLDSYIYPDA